MVEQLNENDLISCLKIEKETLSASISSIIKMLTDDMSGVLKQNAIIDLLAILQKSLDRAIFLYKFIREVRLSGVTASIAIVHIRKFYKL